MKPFKNHQFSDEDFELMINHLKIMEDYMIKLNSGQETPDKGQKIIFNEHFAEVRRLTPHLKLPESAQRVMGEIYRTHPAFANAPPPSKTPAPQPPPVQLAPDEPLPEFQTADELYRYVDTLANLALAAAQQNHCIPEEDKKEILQIIEIMENEPERLPPGFNVDDVKSFYDGVFKREVADAYIKRITVQMAISHNDRWKNKKAN